MVTMTLVTLILLVTIKMNKKIRKQIYEMLNEMKQDMFWGECILGFTINYTF